MEPTDAVQWSLYYPGIISYRDLPLTALPGENRMPPGSPALAAQLGQAETAYDQGRLEPAQADAAAALQQDPNLGRALTILGWVHLQRQEPEKAQSYFLRVRQLDDRAIVGLALARYRLGNGTGAYELIMTAIRKVRPTPLMLTMAGYFSLMVGRVEEARSLLLAAVNAPPPAGALARAFLAQIELVQNHKKAALDQASRALSLSPRLPHGPAEHGPGENRLLRPARGPAIPPTGSGRRPPLCGRLRLPGQNLVGLRLPRPGATDH